ncbi:MAG TPA: enoyl-CoA hydratase-related protein [Burkholderiaceae bacterium]|jgi:enoyl-CoA hydratase|nr:enoyl-CoA hydratase-related protein [Burkholderiaceae bacterium]
MSTILLVQDGVIATVTLSNPGKLNAISFAMWEQLSTIFATLTQNQSIRCVIVRGAGANFAAGADIEEFPQLRSTVEQGMHYHENVIAPALRAIAECPHPTIAAIEGACVGGGLEIACACDLRIASPSARFGIPINRLGFPLAPGELQGLLQLIGKARTLEILLEGRVFDAVEAKDKGLLQRIADDVHSAAAASATRIAAGAPLAAQTNKAMIRRLTPTVAPLDQQELQAAFSFLTTHDYREGVQSFLDKRDPIFTGT